VYGGSESTLSKSQGMAEGKVLPLKWIEQGIAALAKV
jgi:hypothetical protein